MNKKLFALFAITIAALLAAPMASAQEPPSIVTAWADSSKYAPGAKGTMYIAFYNDMDVAVTIQNITITYYHWSAYINGAWTGNETRRNLNIPLSKKSTYLFSDVTFTVPSDGRGIDTPVYVTIGTDYGYKSGTGYISVPQTPSYMEQIVTLFTILVVLIIVCTVIIAATIFLSARRHQITWKEEPKA